MRPGTALGQLATGAVSLEDVIERIELTGDGRQPLQCELEAFVGTVLGGGSPIVSGEEGLRALGVALQIVQCIEQGLDATLPV
jgi:predicted dehydrogenase